MGIITTYHGDNNPMYNVLENVGVSYSIVVLLKFTQ